MKIDAFARKMSLILVSILANSCTAAEPIVFLLDPAHLLETRQNISLRPQDFESALRVVRDEADLALSEGPWSVMDKHITPPSGNKHDYYSVGPYWWPDLTKPEGLPYVRRDGEVNPDRYDYDNVGLKKMVAAVESLARAWFFTDRREYSERAAVYLRTWFMNPATKMNPNLQYGQAIPGITEGRGIGIIDTAQLIYLVDAVGLLRSSQAWSDTDQAALQDWFRAYLYWLRNSSHGLAEANTKNNHAIWYDAQVAAFALFVEDERLAREVLEQVGSRRIATQIEPDGRMLQELARTKSFSYSLMNLRGLLHLARLGENVDVDLWRYRSPDGRSVEAALDWLEPYVEGRKEWQWKQISTFDAMSATLLYRRAGKHLDKPGYHRLGSVAIDPLTDLLWPKFGE